MLMIIIALYLATGVYFIPKLAQHEAKVLQGQYTRFSDTTCGVQANNCTQRAALKSVIWPYTVAMARSTGGVQKALEQQEEERKQLVEVRAEKERVKRRIAILEAQEEKDFQLALQTHGNPDMLNPTNKPNK